MEKSVQFRGLTGFAAELRAGKPVESRRKFDCCTRPNPRGEAVNLISPTVMLGGRCGRSDSWHPPTGGRIRKC